MMQSFSQSAKLSRQEAYKLQILLQMRLASMARAGDPTAVMVECRKIRKRFLTKLGPTGTAFTFPFEFDALVALESKNLAWRQLLIMERSLGNRRLDTVTGDLSLDEAWRALHLYGPLLYLDGRYAKARQMMELGLNPWFDGSRRRYRNLFIYVGNRDQPPKFRQRVTLLHVYQALGESLASWPHWLEFVRTVPIEVLRNGCVSRNELRENPTRIVGLHSTQHPSHHLVSPQPP